MKEIIIDTEREEALKRFGLIFPLLEEDLCVVELARKRCLLQREGHKRRSRI